MANSFELKDYYKLRVSDPHPAKRLHSVVQVKFNKYFI